MRIIGVIPARYASTRFPGKPLAVIEGKTMIMRVYEQACFSGSLDKVIVATDDERIARHVAGFGGCVEMTGTHHQSGTERCREVAANLTLKGEVFDYLINIQGDEPFIDPGQIDELANGIRRDKPPLATLIRRITNAGELHNPNVVKVTVDHQGFALYFSRSPIPFARGVAPENWLTAATYYKHVGIYGYRNQVLDEIVALSSSPLEQTESLEQLRWIENGYRIRTYTTDYESIAIDVPGDLLKITNRIHGSG